MFATDYVGPAIQSLICHSLRYLRNFVNFSGLVRLHAIDDLKFERPIPIAIHDYLNSTCAKSGRLERGILHILFLEHSRNIAMPTKTARHVYFVQPRAISPRRSFGSSCTRPAHWAFFEESFRPPKAYSTLRKSMSKPRSHTCVLVI